MTRCLPTSTGQLEVYAFGPTVFVAPRFYLPPRSRRLSTASLQYVYYRCVSTQLEHPLINIQVQAADLLRPVSICPLIHA